jgi:tRNA(fMet)-specific endonuclease VapC
MIMLDTDICIYLLNGRAPGIERQLRDLPRKGIGTSAITAAELHYGALHSAHPKRNLERVRDFLAPLRRVPFGDEAAEQFGLVKQALSRRGKLIGPLDLLIAATALSIGAQLVTNNKSEFKRVPSLRIADWEIVLT